ncbi:MAG TPA: hypothetical protein VNZ55_05760 [Thermomicrobiales bacterium]|nr:hypothetical protein [Thermomicrobiales bacterium]
MHSPDDDLVKALCTAPRGWDFFRFASFQGMSPEQIASPLTTFELLANAVDVVSEWNDNRYDLQRQAAREGHQFVGLAREVLSTAGAAWWFDDLNQRPQLSAANPPRLTWDIRHPQPPGIPPTPGERYTQKPMWAQYTSTEHQGTSSFLFSAERLSGDLGPMAPGSRIQRLLVPLTARVLTIRTAMDWHNLCLSYAAPGERGEIVPDYSLVAQDWDAVHISLGAMLCASLVRVTLPDGRWTEMTGWDAEMTVWIQDVLVESGESWLWQPG